MMKPANTAFHKYSETNKVEIVDYGAIGPLLALTRASDPRVQRNTTGALLNLTHIGQ